MDGWMQGWGGAGIDDRLIDRCLSGFMYGYLEGRDGDTLQGCRIHSSALARGRNFRP